ncbi:hypothetical protein [Pseudomonas hunanensis]|uniref:hypothetical protein n=1 Tax=Pseudomonas hunanensis TaxID=1247546 RepID=UPI0030DD3101
MRDKKLLAKLTGSIEALPAEAQTSLVRGSINKFTPVDYRVLNRCLHCPKILKSGRDKADHKRITQYMGASSRCAGQVLQDEKYEKKSASHYA